MLWCSLWLAPLIIVGSGLQCSAVTTAPSASQQAHQLLNRLQAHYQSTSSLRANFTETIARPGAPPVERHGVIYYAKPGKLRWQFEGTQPETIVSDGRTIYDYDPGLNQVVETPLSQAFRNQAASALLLGFGNLERDFVAARAGPGANGLERLVLRPKTGGQPIELGIEPRTADVVTVTMADAMGNITRLQLSGLQLNTPLKASLFKFSPPSGADIVSAESPQ